MLSSHPVSHLRPAPEELDLSGLDFNAFERVLFDVQQLARTRPGAEVEEERREMRPIVLEEGWDVHGWGMVGEAEMEAWERVLGEVKGVKRKWDGDEDGVQDHGQSGSTNAVANGDQVRPHMNSTAFCLV